MQFRQRIAYGIVWMTFIMVVRVSAAGMTTPHELDISPTEGCDPLTIRLSGEVQMPYDGYWYKAYIYWGDGKSFSYVAHWTVESLYIDEQHTYESPGVYTVRRTLHWFDDPTPDFVDDSTIITVSSSGVIAESDPPEAECPTRFRVISADSGSTCLAGAVVQWGDGEFNHLVWEEDLARYVSPFHDYVDGGQYTIRIPNTFSGGGEPLAVLDIVAGCTTPVEATSWGRVKSLYR